MASFEGIEEYHADEKAGDLIGGESFYFFCTLRRVIAIDPMDPSSPPNTNTAVDNHEGPTDGTPFSADSLGVDHGRSSIAPTKAITLAMQPSIPLSKCSPATYPADVPTSAGHVKK